MFITGHELTAGSSAVAALAIVGGYLGIRSANRNALTIAREERSSKRQDELDALKRAVYTQTLSSLTALVAVNIEAVALVANTSAPPSMRIDVLRRRTEAIRKARDSITELELVSSRNILRDLANEAFRGAAKASQKEVKAFTRGMAKLQVSLRDDLLGREISSPEELDRMVDNAMNPQSSELKSGVGEAT